MTVHDDLSKGERLRGILCPVHLDHKLALVGEAPGPRTRADCPFYPYPPTSAAGRLLAYLGWTRSKYLLTFARMNLLSEWPGPSFPVARARECVPDVVAALHPRPLLLMGRGVAAAFRASHLPPCVLVPLEVPHRDRGTVVARVAVVPHTSGRNLWYNEKGHQRLVRDFINRLAEIYDDPTPCPAPVRQYA
jgi:hypothetical protein